MGRVLIMLCLTANPRLLACAPTVWIFAFAEPDGNACNLGLSKLLSGREACSSSGLRRHQQAACALMATMAMTERKFLIQIDALPEAEDRRAILELILAAVSLEISATVLLSDGALSLFDSASDSSWLQLVEHDLVDVVTREVPENRVIPAAIRRIDLHDRAKLVDQCTVIRI